MQTECTRIEKMIKDPANRVVECGVAGICPEYELRDKNGRVLLRAFGEANDSEKRSKIPGGFYNPDFSRVNLARYYEYKILFEMVQVRCRAQVAKERAATQIARNAMSRVH